MSSEAPVHIQRGNREVFTVARKEFGHNFELSPDLQDLRVEFDDDRPVRADPFEYFGTHGKNIAAIEESPRKIVKALQYICHLTLESNDIKNMYGWVKEEHDRLRGEQVQVPAPVGEMYGPFKEPDGIWKIVPSGKYEYDIVRPTTKSIDDNTGGNNG